MPAVLDLSCDICEDGISLEDDYVVRCPACDTGESNAAVNERALLERCLESKRLPSQLAAEIRKALED